MLRSAPSLDSPGRKANPVTNQPRQNGGASWGQFRNSGNTRKNSPLDGSHLIDCVQSTLGHGARL